ncbi:MAG: CHAD domain-containing protein [Dehalococcoidia bacterium]
MAGRGPIEVEWQFDAPDLEAVDAWLRAQPAHAALALEERPPKRQRDTYFDTAEWRLFHAGLSLRSRIAGGDAETTLKALPARGDGPVARAEQSEPGEIEAVQEGVSALADRLRLMLRGQPLRPLFTVATHRRTWLARAGDDVLAEIALDDTTVEAPTGVTSVLRRVEVEQVAPGGLARVEAFLDAMRAECALERAAGSKFDAGLATATAGARPGPPDLGPTAIAADDRAVDRAYAVLRRRTGEFLAREAGTALGEDPEQLHAMRVATRRLRAAMRVFDAVLPPALLEARDELRWFAQELGAVRDLDVQLEHLEQLRATAVWAEATALAPLVTQFERRRIEAREALLAAIAGDRYARLVTALRTALLAGPAPDAPDVSSADEARRVILRRYRRFETDAAALRPRSPHEAFHALRIRGKRLRYSLELFMDLAGRPGGRALASLRALQDLLGELQDLATTDERLRALVRDEAASLPPDTLVMIGRLMERHEERAAEIVRAFPRARAALLRDFARVRRRLRPPAPPVEEPAPAVEATDLLAASESPAAPETPETPEALPTAPIAVAQRALTVITTRPRPSRLAAADAIRAFIRFFRGRR